MLLKKSIFLRMFAKVFCTIYKIKRTPIHLVIFGASGFRLVGGHNLATKSVN